jgi:class 3 adenylate cyclase
VGIDGFSPISSIGPRPPGDYRDPIGPILTRYGGGIVAFRGDDAICVFDSATRAVDAARAIVAAWAERVGPQSTAVVRVGIASGPIFDGAIDTRGGPIEAMTGGTLRLADRLHDRCRAAGVQLLMCLETARRASADYDARPVEFPSRDDDEEGSGIAYEPVARSRAIT